MALLVPLFFMIFFMRALYFAPYGEMGLPPLFRLCDCGRLIRCLRTLLFRLSLFRRHSDTFPGQEGYRYLFATLATLGTGCYAASILRRRMGDGLKERIAEKVALLDEKLGLQGEEKPSPNDRAC